MDLAGYGNLVSKQVDPLDYYLYFLQCVIDRLKCGLSFASIFDHFPTLTFYSRSESQNDTFLGNVKVTSLKLNVNLTLDQFIQIYIDNLYSIRSADVRYRHQDNLLPFPGYEINYSFVFANNVKIVKYNTLELFIEKGDRVYVISYNASDDSYSKFLKVVVDMLDSFNPI